MSDTLMPDSEPQNLAIREAIEAKVSAADVMEKLADRLLSSTNAHAIRKGLKLAAELARIVTEEEQGPMAAVSPDDLRRLGAAFAAVILDESARFDWKAHPSVGSFLQQLCGRHSEAREALVTGATLNARVALPCITCKQAPRRPNQRTCKGCHAEAMRESRRRKRAQVAALTQAPQPMPWPRSTPRSRPASGAARYSSRSTTASGSVAIYAGERRRQRS